MARSPVPFVACALLLVGETTALADSYNPLPDQRIPSPNGQYYVVMRRIGGPVVYGEWGPVEFEIAEIAKGSTPVNSVTSQVEFVDEYNMEKGGQAYRIVPSGVEVRPGDRVLGRGKLRRPRGVVVSSSGLGFVGFDVYGFNHADDRDARKRAKAVLLVSASGKIIHTIGLHDIFSADELDGFDATAGGLDWLNTWIPGWIDEGKKRVVVIGNSSDAHRNRHLVRFIEWESGKGLVGTTLESQEEVSRLRDKSDKAVP
jgi:hypothetical protein